MMPPTAPGPEGSGQQGKLEQRLQKLSIAVEQTPTVIMITDLHGMIEYVNPAFEQVTGYSLAEAIGANPRILRSGQMPPEVYQDLWATISAGKVWRGEFCNRKKNGELYWDFGTVSPVRSPEGVVTHYVSVKEDITARKQTEAELQQYREYLETLVDARTAELSAEINERKRTEEILREKERRLAEAQRIGRLGSWEWNLTSGEWAWSEEACRILEADPAQPCPLHLLERVPPEEREVVEAALNAATTSGQALSLDHHLISRRVVHLNGILWPAEARLVGTLQDISERVRIETELLEKERMTRELDIARQIQFSMLPKACPVLPGWQFSAFYQPARQVGGDFYDFIRLPSGRLGLAIADVVDKGVPAALMMALSRAVLRSAATNTARPADVLVHCNQILFNDQIANAFVTTLFAVLDPHSGQIDLANAGHSRPLWYSTARHEAVEIKSSGMALGLFPNVTIEAKTITLLPGDGLVLYTDGLSEGMNARDEFYGVDRLVEILAAHAGQDADYILEAIRADWLGFMGSADQADDISVVVIKRVTGTE